MTDEIVRKLSVILNEPITTEAEVVYVLIQVRKLLDRKEEERKELKELYKQELNADLADGNHLSYLSLRLYCNWVAHTCLEFGMAKDVVKEVDALYPRLVTGTLTDEEKGSFRRRFSFEYFRTELEQFLSENGLPRFTEAGWNAFLLQFLGVIRDCPLTFRSKDGALKNVDKVMLISEQEQNEVWAGDPPPIIWSLHLGDTHKFMITANLV